MSEWNRRASDSLEELKRTISELIEKRPEDAVALMVQLEIVSILATISSVVSTHNVEVEKLVKSHAVESGARTVVYWLLGLVQTIILAMSAFAFNEVASIHAAINETRAQISENSRELNAISLAYAKHVEEDMRREHK